MSRESALTLTLSQGERELGRRRQKEPLCCRVARIRPHPNPLPDLSRGGVAVQDKCPFKRPAEMSLGQAAMAKNWPAGRPDGEVSFA